MCCRPCGESRGGKGQRYLSRRFIEVTDEYLPIGKHGANLEMSAKGFDVFNQRADSNVGPVLDLGNFALVYAQRFAKLQLSQLP